MHRAHFIPAFLFLLAASLAIRAGGQTYQVTVEAGELERRSSVVAFVLPDFEKAATPVLRHQGQTVPLQLGRDGRAAFVTGQIKRGESVSYELKIEVPARTSPAGIALQRAHPPTNQVRFAFSPASGGAPHPLFAYQAEAGILPRADIKETFRRGGYLHPIRTLSGKLVTDDFPANHVHHHGVWWAWTSTEFDGRKPDFWNMGDGKGRVEFVALDEAWDGPVHGGFRSRHQFVDLTSGQPVTALNETWQVTAYAPPDGSKHWFFDLTSEQQCATTGALKLPTYRYGGIGVRGNWAWNGKDKTTFLTSEGETDRDKGNATRARWCDMGGTVDGGPAGIAILCHPENFRAPQPMRLHPTEPFFNFAPQQAGDMEIKPGEKYVSKYRFVIHDGPPDRAEINRIWNDYAHPPAVTVTSK